MKSVRQELQNDLRQVYNAHVERRRNIKLPSRLIIEESSDGLVFRLDANAVTTNMQTDGAAFEAWALILRLWLGEERVRRVVLDWEIPSHSRNGHYQRFLYRAAQFHSLFPKWFNVLDPRKLDCCRALSEPQPLLNVAAARPNGAESSTTSAEHKLEMGLFRSERFRQCFGLTASLVDRQFPVGLFAGRVTAKSNIFPGGKSAIDLVGVGQNGAFYIFELKARKNIKAGVLSELLLYSSLIREASQNEPRIKFADTIRGSRAVVHAAHVQQCIGLNAVILVDELHPALEHPALIPTLNEAADETWNAIAGTKPLHFLAWVGASALCDTAEPAV